MTEADGNFNIIKGYKNSYYAVYYKDNIIIKFIDENGSIKWEKEVSSFTENSIITNKGSVIAYELNEKHYLLHSDENGEAIFEKGPFDYLFFYKVEEINANLFGIIQDYKLVFYDSDGNEVHTFASYPYNAFSWEKTSDNGGIIIKFDGNYYLEKYDKDFNFEWEIGPYNYIEVINNKNNEIILYTRTSTNSYQLEKFALNGNQVLSTPIHNHSTVYYNSIHKLIIVITSITDTMVRCLDNNFKQLWKKDLSPIKEHYILDNDLILITYDKVIKLDNNGDIVLEYPVNKNIKVLASENDGVILMEVINEEEIAIFKISHNLDEIFRFAPLPFEDNV